MGQTTIPTFSQQSRPYALLSGHCWAETHFDRACWSVYRSGRVCPGSGGSQLRPFDMDSCKPAFMSCTPRPASSSLRRPSLQALTLLGGARFIAWRPFLGKCQWSPRHFWSHQACLGYSSALDPPKKSPCATLIRLVGQTTNTDFLPAVKPDSMYRHFYLLY